MVALPRGALLSFSDKRRSALHFQLPCKIAFCTIQLTKSCAIPLFQSYLDVLIVGMFSEGRAFSLQVVIPVDSCVAKDHELWVEIFVFGVVLQRIAISIGDLAASIGHYRVGGSRIPFGSGA